MRTLQSLTMRVFLAARSAFFVVVFPGMVTVWSMIITSTAKNRRSCRGKKKNAPVEVTIQHHGNGIFSYSNRRLRLSPGDSVVWRCANGDFAVHFGGDTPIEEEQYRGAQGLPSPVATVLKALLRDTMSTLWQSE